MAKDSGRMDKDSRSREGQKVASKVKVPVNGKGVPISTFNVPGLSRSHGTPGWLKGPADAAAKKAK